MANLTPASAWSAVPQLETTDQVVGGPGGRANAQAQALLDRLMIVANYRPEDYSGGSDYARIAAAEADAFANGGLLALRPGVTYDLEDNDLSVRCGIAQGSELATLQYAGTGTALTFGTTESAAVARALLAFFPRIANTLKTVNGWAEVAGSIGLRLVNCIGCDMYIPDVLNFENGLELGAIGTGTVVNVIRIGHIRNNKKNLRFNADSDGWTNENVFVGGWLAHFLAEGSNISGVRHVLFENTNHKSDNNRFVGVDLEGNVPEYHVEGLACSYNEFFACRWEAAPPKVHWDGANAFRNVIRYGYNAQAVVVTETGGALRNELHSTSRTVRTASDNGDRLANQSSSASPVFSIFPADAGGLFGLDDGAWVTRVGATNALLAKGSADAAARVSITGSNGRLAFGDGTNAPDAYAARDVVLSLPAMRLMAPGGVRIHDGTAGATIHPACTGDPNGQVYGNVGDTITRLDGGAGTTFYVKESGAGTTAGWVAK